MYRRILVAIDGSFHAEAAARYAIHLAGACDAELYVVYVGGSLAGRDSLDRLVWHAESEAIVVHAVVETGAIVSVIESIVRKEDIDLAVASTMYLSTKTVTMDLMTALPCSVLAIRVAHLGKMTYLKKILVPVMGGAWADERAYLTAKLANVFDGAVTVLHVQTISRSGFMGLTHEKKDITRAHAKRLVKDFVEALSSHDVTVETKAAIERDATSAIITEAASGNHDLILIGATRRDFFRQAIRGNPVKRILRKAPCDVVVWRPAL